MPQQGVIWENHSEEGKTKSDIQCSSGVIVSLGVASYSSASAKEPEHRHE
jgi:hypothetical protein